MHWQPPALAPVGASAVWRACWAARKQAADPRPALAAALCERYSAEVAHLASSGTAALQIAIRLARVNTGAGPVALPAYGCYDMATAVVGAGASISLYDLDPSTLAPDLDSLTAVLAGGARVVVVAPIAGVPVPWDEITQCAAAFGAFVIEDAAQGNGSRWRDQPLGTLGALSVLSFGRGKGWTGGRGGAVLIRDRVLAEYARNLPLPEAGVSDEAGAVLVAAAMALFAHPTRYGLAARLPWLHLGETRYQVPSAVRRLSRAAATLALENLAAADDEAATRRANARTWLDALGEHSNLVTPIVIGARDRPGYLRLPVRLPRASVVLADLGATRFGAAPGYPTTLADLSAVQGCLRTPGPFPGARTLVRELVTLPTHSLTTHHDRRAIINAIVAAPRWPMAVTHESRRLAAASER